MSDLLLKTDEEILGEILDNMLKPDGTLDFDNLRQKGITLTLDELYPEVKPKISRNR